MGYCVIYIWNHLVFYLIGPTKNFLSVVCLVFGGSYVSLLFSAKFILLSKNRSAMQSRPLIPPFHGISSDRIATAN